MTEEDAHCFLPVSGASDWAPAVPITLPCLSLASSEPGFHSGSYLDPEFDPDGLGLACSTISACPF